MKCVRERWNGRDREKDRWTHVETSYKSFNILFVTQVVFYHKKIS